MFKVTFTVPDRISLAELEAGGLADVLGALQWRVFKNTYPEGINMTEFDYNWRELMR